MLSKMSKELDQIEEISSIKERISGVQQFLGRKRVMLHANHQLITRAGEYLQ